tara:strand:+ start:73 stop:510 length:438 start_codon:yes stop_codon:yes gene_type:complete
MKKIILISLIFSVFISCNKVNQNEFYSEFKILSSNIDSVNHFWISIHEDTSITQLSNTFGADYGQFNWAPIGAILTTPRVLIGEGIILSARFLVENETEYELKSYLDNQLIQTDIISRDSNNIFLNGQIWPFNYFGGCTVQIPTY